MKSPTPLRSEFESTRAKLFVAAGDEAFLTAVKRAFGSSIGMFVQAALPMTITSKMMDLSTVQQHPIAVMVSDERT
jgi:hypothetical protein